MSKLFAVCGHLVVFILFLPEIPVEYIDPASIDLTPLVNTLINATHPGTNLLHTHTQTQMY